MMWRQEFDRFILPEKTAADDEKRKKFFDSVNAKTINAKAKREAATAIVDALSLADEKSVIYWQHRNGQNGISKRNYDRNV